MKKLTLFDLHASCETMICPACHLAWRYFVNIVDPLKPKALDEESICLRHRLRSQKLNLNKDQINVLHDVRKIRNGVDHSTSEAKIPNPTWNRVVGVFKSVNCLEKRIINLFE